MMNGNKEFLKLCDFYSRLSPDNRKTAVEIAEALRDKQQEEEEKPAEESGEESL
jgi:hypothetical protein